MHLELIKIVSFKFLQHLKVHLGSVLLRLFLTLCHTPRTEGIVDVDIDVEETFVMCSNPVIGEFPVIDLAVTHEVVLEIVIYHDGVHINHIWVLVNSQNKLLRVYETNIHVDSTDERLKNIFKDFRVVIPPIAHTLLIHDDEFLETQLQCNLG